MRIRTIEHTADTGIEVESDSLNGLFEGAAQGMFQIMIEAGSAVEPELERKVQVSAGDLEELMFEWLNELIFLVDSQKILFSGYDVEITGNDLVAAVTGERFDPARHSIACEVKAATYHRMEVRKEGGGWFARVIFDV